MNSYFERLALDSIALEAAIGAFEAENDITDEYLHDYSDYEAPAYESASTSSDSFGFDIFDDMYAPATEEADTATGKGGKLSQGIKNILASIGKLFTKIKTGIANFFASFKKKKAEVNAEKVKENAAPEALQLANDMRGSIKQAFNIISKITVKDTNLIASLCRDIAAAIDSAGGTDTLVAAHSKLANFVDDDSANTAMSNAGKAFRQNGKFGDDNVNGVKAAKKLDTAKTILDNVEATGKDLDACIDNVREIFKKEYAAAYNKVESRSKKEAVIVEDDDAYDKVSRQENDKIEKDRENRANEKEREAFNKEARRRRSVGNQSVISKDAIPMQTLINQVRQIVFVDYDVTALNTAIQSVITACEHHASDCEKIANKVPANVSGDAKIAYDMCKILSRSSAIYTHISTSIQKLTSGSIFEVTIKTEKGETTTSRSTFHATSQDRTTATRMQKPFLDE